MTPETIIKVASCFSKSLEKGISFIYWVIINSDMQSELEFLTKCTYHIVYHMATFKKKTYLTSKLHFLNDHLDTFMGFPIWTITHFHSEP